MIKMPDDFLLRWSKNTSGWGRRRRSGKGRKKYNTPPILFFTDAVGIVVCRF